tara:strand:+ start:110 stop:922 length:813 start_codon:yes stop_codon:yes gene_type:complete
MSDHKIQINDNSNETNNEVNNASENVSQLQHTNTNTQSAVTQSAGTQSTNTQSTNTQNSREQQSKLLPTATVIGTTSHTISNSSPIRQSYPATFANVPNDSSYLSTHYVETAPESPNLQLTWQYAKTIKCISLIDIFFLTLNSLIAWPFIIFLIGPICGYYGSKKYEVNKIFIYLVYCILRTISIIIQLSYSFKNDYYDDDDSNSTSTNVNKRLHSDGSQLFLLFSIFVQAWISWIVIRLVINLRKLSHTELNTLRIGTFIPIQTRILYY